jgi:photosystem II stability/assembly factor-like uncharacterized protein
MGARPLRDTWIGEPKDLPLRPGWSLPTAASNTARSGLLPRCPCHADAPAVIVYQQNVVDDLACTRIVSVHRMGWAGGAIMKVLLTALVLIAIAGVRTSSLAQPNRDTAGGDPWRLQTSGTSQTLYGVSFVDSSTGWAVGGAGTILHTTDGETWTQQVSGSTRTLESVFFLDASTGWAVGDGGTILQTTDGGESWTLQISNTHEQLYGVAFGDANTGIAVGSNSTAVRTTDGGRTWTLSLYAPGLPPLRGVAFGGATHAVAVGPALGTPPNCTLQQILETPNGGADWSATNIIPCDPHYAVSFADANRWMIVGPRVIYLNFYPYPFNGPYYGVSFNAAGTATAVGAGGQIWRSIDGGHSWHSQLSPTAYDLRGVSFVDANTGTAVGDFGTILRTTTGGE